MNSPLTPYGEWLKTEAERIASDGCTVVEDIAIACCWEHDLGYFYGRCPRDAYRKGDWTQAKRVTRRQVDSRFGSCCPWYLKHRYWGVRLGGWISWRKHRKERP